MVLYIDNSEELLNICDEINKTTNIIALDTEFIKHNEYFPDISIIQFSFFNGKVIQNGIIDVIVDNINLEPFFDILNNPNIKKVFHSCSQDLEGLYHLSKKVPISVDDIQVMAEFCGIRSHSSYQELIKETLKIVVKKDKKIQISNWKERPLSEKQINYAIGDVDYILEIYVYLLQKLDNNKNYKYYKEEMNERYGKNMINNLIKNSWKKMRFKLGNKSYNYIEILKKLCILREKIAMDNNIIKNLIIPDNLLKSLINHKPQNIEEWNELFKDEKIMFNKSKSFKGKFISIYLSSDKNISTDKSNEIQYIIDLKDNIMIKKLEEITDYLLSESKKMNIAPELLINKMDLSSYISNSEKLENVYEKWKIDLFGKRIKEIKER